MRHEPERDIRDESLGLECRLYGFAPVQADGRVLGHRLYFRARWAGWNFIVCTSADIDPSTLDEGRAAGFFVRGEYRGFSLSGDYGTQAEASLMPYDVAERIIRDCAARFAAAVGQADLG
jgi:hypothetical protein